MPLRLSFRRPDKRAVEQNAEAVRVWREQTWPAIRAKAKAEDAEVLFADQVGIRSDQVTGLTWGERGRASIVRLSGNRFSVNTMSEISAKGRMHFMVFTESFDAAVMCCFRDRLAGHFTHKVHLVLDGHSAHRSRKVRAWLAAHHDQVELHYLPAYSLELNPDELVNADLKRSLPMHSRPATRPNLPPRLAGSSTAASANRISSAAIRPLHPRVELFELRNGLVQLLLPTRVHNGGSACRSRTLR